MIFGNRLKALRTQLKLTQKEVAEKLVVSRATIGKYETESAYPDFEKLVALANLFSCSIDYLLGTSSTPKRFSEHELTFMNKVMELSTSEGFISSVPSNEDFRKLYEEVKTAYMAIKLLKRIGQNNPATHK
jgi:transcriptional regulator with XRE-family HTH domain